MNENPYRSPRSIGDEIPKLPAKNYGYFQVSVGYGLLAIYVLAAFSIAQIGNSTGQFDKVVMFQYSQWLIPFAILIPWLALLGLGKRNPLKIRYSAAALLFTFLICSILIFMMFSRSY